MNTENNLTKSPIDKENPLELFLKCKDFTLSNETFTLLKDNKNEIVITNPQPKLDKQSTYYDSEAYISHTDAQKTFTDKMYQKVKSFAIKKKINLVSKFYIKKSIQNSEIKILDLGCGTGDFLLACKNKNYKVVGVEPNKNARVLSKSKLDILTSNYSNINDDYPKVHETINTIEEQFDVITMWHVLEHVPNLKEYIAITKKLLKPEGTLIIAVPNYKSYDATYYKEFWAAYDVPRHLWHFSKKSISLLFKKEKLKVVKIIPMKFDAYYVSLLSEKYKTGKSNLFKAFFRGWLSNFKALSSKEYSSLIYILKNDK